MLKKSLNSSFIYKDLKTLCQKLSSPIRHNPAIDIKNILHRYYCICNASRILQLIKLKTWLNVLICSCMVQIYQNDTDPVKRNMATFMDIQFYRLDNACIICWFIYCFKYFCIKISQRFHQCLLLAICYIINTLFVTLIRTWHGSVS